jgi:myo-inositol-1-phosphate synthase
MIRVALIGVGNVTAALVQALEKQEFYGILELPLSPKEIKIVSAFDIDKRKVGKKLSEAIFAKPNVVEKYIEVKNDVIVQRGPTLDGKNGILSEIIEESPEKPVNVAEELKKNKVDVVVNLLPTGADKASEYYALAALEAKAAFINATPSQIKRLSQKFEENKVPIFGDDLLSQIGGTVFHAGLIEFLKFRGVKVTKSYQVDIAGTTEAYVTLEEWRKEKKKEIKSSFISGHDNIEVVAGTSDYVQFLKDRRISYIYIEGIYGFGVPIQITISLKTLDSPNAVTPLIDLIRIAKILKDKGIGGIISDVCAYYFKDPPVRYNLVEAKRRLEQFLRMIEPRTDK